MVTGRKGTGSKLCTRRAEERPAWRSALIMWSSIKFSRFFNRSSTGVLSNGLKIYRVVNTWTQTDTVVISELVSFS